MSREIIESFPLTVGQTSIWIAQAVNSESPAFNIGECVEIIGDLDCEAFERALRATIAEADSLSLGFVETEDGPRQFFAPDRHWELDRVDFSATSDSSNSSRAWMSADMARPLDLSASRPFRCALLRLSEEKQWFYGVVHHLVSDGFSWRLVLRRIAENYRNVVSAGKLRPRPFLSIADILARERVYRNSSQFTRDREYWLSQLRGRPKPSLGSTGGRPSDAVELASGFISRSFDLAAFGRPFGASALAVFVAAVVAYIFRQTNEVDIVVGLQVSARLGDGMRDALGFVTNIVPLRMSLEPTWSFARLVEAVAPRVREAMRHQQYRVEDLRRDLAIPPGGPDLFNVVINFFPLDETIAFNERPVRRFLLGNWSVPGFQIVYYDGGEPEGRRVDMIANVGRYDATLVRLHADRFCQFFETIAAAARMYRTDDLGLGRHDGAVEFHGRNDNQVNIRGVRVELCEIEAQLKSLPGVREAVVVVQGLATDVRRLIGFFVAKPGTQADGDATATATLRRQLSRKIPEAMLPSALYPLEALPRQANGKLDRAALLDLCAAVSVDVAADARAPSTPTEIALAEIWRDLLGFSEIDRRDDFFDVGGHSLLVTRVRSRIRARFGIDPPLKLLFENRVLADLAKAVDSFDEASHREHRRIEPAAERDNWVLSYSQQRMWLIQSLDPETTAYNLAGAVKLRGPLNVEALSQAFDEVRRRHVTLRSVFFDAPTGVRQRVLPFRSERLEVTDMRAHGGQALEEAVRLAERDAQTPFVLESGPVMRVLLFQISNNEHLLHVSLHHISGDQWSFGVLSRELSAAYNAFCEGRRPDLPPLRIQYGDYATWQRSDQQVARTQTQLTYWRRKLEGLPPLDLPTNFPRPRLRTSSGAFVRVSVPTDLLKRLERLSRQEGATLFMTMLAAFAALLSRLTGQNDIGVGVPIANRTVVEIEPLVGTFVNTLVMRVDLSGRPTFRELLIRVRDVAMEAYSHQDASFDELVQAVARPRDDGRPPLVQVMFNMLNAPSLATSLNQLAWEDVVIDRRGAQFEISVSVDPQVSKAIVFEYNADLFKSTTIQRLAARYLQLMESALADATTPVARLNLLPPTEAKLLEEWNATFTPRVSEATFIRTFERRAAEYPDAEALRFEDETVCYGELNRRAESISRHLRNHGVKPGVGVGVCLRRTPFLLAALLAVQKAGGHYIPLDPAAPRKRLEFMLEDSGLSVLIAADEISQSLEIAEHVARLDPQTLSTPTAVQEDRGEPGELDLAYIIYTSGSTGRPKGVRITQRGLANFLAAVCRRPGMTAQDSIVAITTISFDISGLEFYLPLCVGGRIVLAPTEVAIDGERLIRLLNESGASALQATPATWRMLLDAGWTGAATLRAFCGGEALSSDLARELLPRVKELWNLYGPTETTIWSTAGRVEADSPISIGAPIDNTRIYIADAEGGICPIGVVGEIWIAGDGVAQGYQNRPELTGERFQRDPFAEGADQCMYKTGDLGVWGVDGRLYHCGRLDNQLKVRGFRVEAEEVETLLRGHPAVRDAAVAARSAGEGDTRLVAYLIADAGRLPTSSELRTFLREIAPHYMVPSMFIELDKLPLTTNGKIDRRALPDPFKSSFNPADAVQPPATIAEKTIAEIWRQVLNVETVGADDNFFELGGHSLLALRVAALVKMKTGWRMDPRTLYFQTLQQVAKQSELPEPRGQVL